MVHQHGIERAAQLLRDAQRIVVLTGAGVSRPSGIPDFRSDAGLWHQANPMEVASLQGFRSNPRRFFEWVRPVLRTIGAAQPNPAHLAVAQLAQLGKQVAVVTQNIDGLHQSAGSREVFELHGHLRSATCLECDKVVPGAPVLAQIQRGKIPHCHCGGLLKPDVVLFDELLPRGLYWLAERAAQHCDVILVAGTSLEVAPACELPIIAQRRGARLIIVNQGDTYLDPHADIVLHEDVAATLPAIVELVAAKKNDLVHLLSF